MIITVASGKGGTGKTTVATNLAFSIEENVQFLDCDVEEPNAHLFIDPEISGKYSVGIPVPEIDASKCGLCGQCQAVCAFNAIAVLRDHVLVFPEICHGCGACSYLCPQGAITEVKKEIGSVEIGAKGPMQFVHGRLNLGAAMAPPLIKEVKRYMNPTRTVIMDAPPGTSCPMIETVKASDFCLLVTEPTPFGLNDLKLTVEVLKKLQIPFGVVINRCDVGDERTREFCSDDEIPVFLEIPFKKEIAACYSRGGVLVHEFPEYKKDYRELFAKIKQCLQTL